jgi:hypothetical protein
MTYAQLRSLHNGHRNENKFKNKLQNPANVVLSHLPLLRLAVGLTGVVDEARNATLHSCINHLLLTQVHQVRVRQPGCGICSQPAITLSHSDHLACYKGKAAAMQILDIQGTHAYVVYAGTRQPRSGICSQVSVTLSHRNHLACSYGQAGLAPTESLQRVELVYVCDSPAAA